MKISYNWLKEYIDIDLSVDELAQKITDAGLEVEEIVAPPVIDDAVVVGYVESIEKHPDADKLNICSVNVGHEIRQIVCGAPNVKAGQTVPVAGVGAKLPVGIKIKKAKIRGVTSFGMICSREELGLESHSEGIWPLDTDMAIGEPLQRFLEKKQDYILDLFITPNRADCFSHIGIAREIAAFTGKNVKLPPLSFVEKKSPATQDLIDVEIEYPKGCPRYAARVIQDVTIGESPEWLKTKLESIGQRSINNVVDITNFILNELGQPLHAFDYDQVEGHKIIVKKSSPGQKFTTLDSKERILPENTVMICDTEKPVAIGGIMGGLNSEVTSQTKTILLESAYFNPVNIVTSCRKLGLISDASQRFEKGTDYDQVIYALDRAAQLIAEVAGGTLCKGFVDVYPEPLHPPVIPFEPGRVNRILGTALDDAEIMTLLKSVKIIKTEKGMSTPSYRTDLKEDIDLIEEVARLKGYDNLPTSTVEPVSIEQMPKKNDMHLARMRTALLETGLQEIFTNSMVSKAAGALEKNQQPVAILNPISDDLSTMRTTLLHGCLSVIGHNVKRNMPDLRLFELGRVFYSKGENVIPEQPIHCAIAITGNAEPGHWSNPKPLKVDFFDLNGIIETYFEKLLLDRLEFVSYSNQSKFDAHQAVQIRYNNKIIGEAGKVDSSIIKTYGFEKDVYFAELNASLLETLIKDSIKYKTIAKFPSSERDLAFIVDKNLPAAELLNFIKKQGGKILKDVSVFDLYSGDKVDAGKKSIAFRLSFQSDIKTLNDKEIDRIFKKIIQQAEKNYSAVLRDK